MTEAPDVAELAAITDELIREGQAAADAATRINDALDLSLELLRVRYGERPSG